MKAFRVFAGFIFILIFILIIPSDAQLPLDGWGEPVPVTELNGIGDEFFPYLSANGQIMIFSAMGTVTMSYWTGNSWGPREYLPSPINNIGLQRMAAITPDLLWIYWVSWRAGGMGGWDIWRSQYDDSTGTWGDAEPLGPNVNSTDNEFGMCFTLNGSRMYFITDTFFKNGQYGQGATDVWYSDWDSTVNDWGPAFNMGSPINITENEDYPYISSDGNYLFFSSWGSHRLSGWQGLQDIYIAMWNGSEWITENMGSPINSPSQECGASISSDLSTFYFCRLVDSGPEPNYDIMVSYREPLEIGTTILVPEKKSIEISAYPNPFNSTINIKLSGDCMGLLRLEIYNLLGQKIWDYFICDLNGNENIRWRGVNSDGLDVSSGIYFVLVRNANFTAIRRIVLLR